MIPTATALDPETAVVWLLGYALFVSLGGWIAVLAFRIRLQVPSAETILWEYFALVGSAGLLTGLLGLLRVAGGESARAASLSGVADALLLAFALLCALSMREAYFNTVLSNTERDRGSEHRRRRALEGGFVLAVLFVGIGSIVAGITGTPLAVGGVTVVAVAVAVAVVCYGLYFHRKRTRLPATRGTVIDTLLRQLVPALSFAGGALAVPPLLERFVAPSVASAVTAVLVVMAATALVSVTIKVRQHLAVQR